MATVRILSEFQVKRLRMAFLDKNILHVAINVDNGDVIIEYTGGSGPNEWEGVVNTMAIPFSPEFKAAGRGWRWVKGNEDV